MFATGFTLLASLHRRISGAFFGVLAVNHDSIQFPATPSPLPGFLPGCLVMSSTTAGDGYAVAGVIASLIYETGEPINAPEIE